MEVEKNPVNGKILFYSINDGSKGDAAQCLSYALVTTEENGIAVLWHIHTQKHFRRKGYAQKILDQIKTEFESIFTGIGTQEGNMLCVKNGFVRRGAHLIWKRKSEKS